ncbi:AAA family ATPase [Streptomyces sp. BI20]|uniref:AAA family ATPase n=1 Tax=Streptomyces sp. BI20 TaxID=3403460 RepID=UPI003C7883D5
MRLHRLRVTAFGPFAGTQEIDFDTLAGAGLFLLHGPTGAGKTTVLDAVCFALYGGVPGARRQHAGRLRSDHADPDTATSVTLELTVAGRRLELTRSPEQQRPKRRGTGTTTEKAKSLLREKSPGPDGAWRPLSDSHQEIAEEIGALLGMNQDQFCQVVLLPQGEFAAFLRAKPDDRAKLLGRLFDTRRFAAVEEHLAERRREADAQVRAGDEKVLATAHRLAQEAGDAAPPRDWPFPDHEAGDPGLGAALRGWIAVARTGAVERRTVAELAAQETQTRHDALRHAAEAARELDRLQRRHAETARRAEALAADGPERDRVRARLDRALRAEQVAPVLELRGHADTALRAAHLAEETARLALPRDFREVGADRLEEMERELSEERGAAQAALRAENRAADITRERDLLDTRDRAAAAELADHTRWSAGRAARRAELADRLARAETAGGLAEHLAARIEPARRHLADTRRREELAARVTAGEDEHAAARDRAGAAREHWLDLKEARLRGIAAELAQALAAGEPCAVCGSAEHPAPARPAPDQVDRAAEEEARAAHERAEARRTELDGRLAGLRDTLAELRERVGDGSVADAEREHADLTARHAEAARAAADLPAARAAREHAEAEDARRTEDRGRAESAAAARAARRTALAEEEAELTAELRAVLIEGADTVTARIAELDRRIRLVTGAARTGRALAEAADRLKEADGRVADATYRAGFTHAEEAAEALLDGPARRAAQGALDAWQAEEALLAERFAETDAEAAARRPAADPVGAEERAARAQHAARKAASTADAARARCRELDRLAARADTELRALGPLRERHERVARMAGLTAGTASENERKMRLESYVLAARLEQVAAAASQRLLKMSDGRYTLVHSDSRTGRGRAGLGLHVVDAYTGRERDTATLSGGETFFASLALALGLTDVVTDEAGGVRIDTLFVDEGFGSLDDQALDQVLEVLDSLRERDRSVGIVSHVADLRTRVAARLEITKGRTGSRAVLRLGADTD